jgi:hypothetical protein
MRLFHRRDAPPADVLAQLPRDERVVSWADTPDERVVVATPSALWWPEPDALRPIGWQFIDKATWRERVLVVVEAELVGDLLLVDRPPVAAELHVPRDLPPTVRKRIETNVVRSQVLPVPGGAARFVTRRIPGSDGLGWWARLEPGTPDTDEVRSAVAARVARMRAEWDAERAEL